jgi:hypothetical protein
MRPLVTQIQLPLHRQFRVRELSFRVFLCLFSLSHLFFTPEKRTRVEGSLVAFKYGDK